METVKNIRIKDIMAMLTQLHYDTEAVDISTDPENGRILIGATEEVEESENPQPEDPNKVEIKGNDLGEII